MRVAWCEHGLEIISDIAKVDLSIWYCFEKKLTTEIPHIFKALKQKFEKNRYKAFEKQ